MIRIAVVLVSLALATMNAQNGRPCAKATSVVDRAICANPALAAIDQDFEQTMVKLNPQGFEDEVQLALRRQWDRDVARCVSTTPGGPVDEACIRAAYDRRSNFLRYQRIAEGLEPGPPDGSASLAKLRSGDAPELTRDNAFELLTMHPVLAPVAAAQLGSNWIYWALNFQPGNPASAAVPRFRPLPGTGRWLVARGSKIGKGSEDVVYFAVDLEKAQLHGLRFYDYSGDLYEPITMIDWTTTARDWPAEATKALSSTLPGRVWQPQYARKIGLPSTRLPHLPLKKPDCSAVEGAAPRIICGDEELRHTAMRTADAWKDLAVLSLINDLEYEAFTRTWKQEDDACPASSLKPCLADAWQKRSVFVQSRRISLGLDSLSPVIRQMLTEVGKKLPAEFTTYELLTTHSVVAPVTASLLGPEWLSWAESAASGYAAVTDDGKYVLARGFFPHSKVNQDLYVAIDLKQGQLSILHFAEYYPADPSKPIDRSIEWASTATAWPVAVTALFEATGGGAFENGMQRRIGLPSTRLRVQFPPAATARR